MIARNNIKSRDTICASEEVVNIYNRRTTDFSDCSIRIAVCRQFSRHALVLR